MRDVVFSSQAKIDYQNWEHENPKIFIKLTQLIDSTVATPFHGIGKPEPLRHQYAGCWSRRMTDKHRLVYRVQADGSIFILTCRGHYTDK